MKRAPEVVRQVLLLLPGEPLLLHCTDGTMGWSVTIQVAGAQLRFHYDRGYLEIYDTALEHPLVCWWLSKASAAEFASVVRAHLERKPR